MTADLELFVEQTGWLAPRLKDPSRRGVMTWIAARLHESAARRLRHYLPVNSHAQVLAEEAVASLLARPITSTTSKVRRCSAITRQIDWAATYAMAETSTRPPQPYVTRTREPVPDRVTLGALVALAHSWACMLEFVSDGAEPESAAFAARAARLRAACAPRMLASSAPAPFTAQHIARLRRLGTDAAEQARHIQEALAYWDRAFGGAASSDADALACFARLLDSLDAQNVDTLLEVSVTLSIARAAVQAASDDWPTAQPWTIVSVEAERGGAPRIRLRSEDLVCQIQKGTPTRCEPDGTVTKLADLLSPWADEALPTTGKTRSTGRQPDIVVSFWRQSAPTVRVFALGDAKRNATGTGERYIRDALEVAATYLMSFGYGMGLQVPGASGGSITTALCPGVTLFCRQGTGCSSANAIARLRGAEPLPVLMAFDLAQHMHPGERPWHAPVLAAWLGRLGRQAGKLLRG